MGKSDLQNWLLTNSGFQLQYRRLLVESVRSQFANLELPQGSEQPSHDWRYLLLCASLLAQSTSEVCQDTALRIAQHCMVSASANDVQKDGGAIIFDMLANRLSIHLSEKRKFLRAGVEGRLPFSMLRDWGRRSIVNSITLANGQSITVNKFQRQFWDSAKRESWVSVSAPTSAGKSFIIEQWLCDFIRTNREATVVYLVPTRALIHQVEEDLRSLFTKEGVSRVSISVLPLPTAICPQMANVCIFTQERLNILLVGTDGTLRVDALIVDEAHKIGDSYRGVLLQQAIESIISGNRTCRVLFASPQTENPEILLDDSPPGISSHAISGEEITVNQNLLWVSQVPRKPRKWDVDLILDSESVNLGQVTLTNSPTQDSKRLTFVAHALRHPDGGNVVYVDGAAKAEKAALQLYDLLGAEADCGEDPSIKNLVDLIRKIVHKDYTLARVLHRGIAFHYGNMPLLIRTEIEKAFQEGTIRFLICTSTLIEGVNMPCRNIFVRGPHKGLTKPMNAYDFWNLAGRAGRWGKEFQGNVVCVDPRQLRVWEEPAPRSRKRQRIARTTDTVLDNLDALLSFVAARTPRDVAYANPTLEYVFSYLVSSHIRFGSISEAPWAKRLAPSTIAVLDGVIAEVRKALKTPDDIILRNPGISPFAMDDLLSYFEHREKPIEEFIPPPAESEDAADVYTHVLGRSDKYLGRFFGTAARTFQLALLVVDWMKGYPLARIIADRQKYFDKHGRQYTLPALIRDAMRDVEETARFQAPKYLGCYVDLLRVFFREKGRDDLLKDVTDVHILLEFGVSAPTQLSLIGLGLSRPSVLMLSEFIADNSLSGAQCLDWLRANDWMTKDMPELVKQEIARVLQLQDTVGATS
jgi:prepilin-type processing-associated H-X9-DG protein